MSNAGTFGRPAHLLAETTVRVALGSMLLFLFPRTEHHENALRDLAAGEFDHAVLEVLGGFGAPDGPRDKEGRLVPPGQTDCEYWPEGPRADALAFVLGHRVQCEVRDQVRRDPDPDAGAYYLRGRGRGLDQ